MDRDQGPLNQKGVGRAALIVAAYAALALGLDLGPGWSLTYHEANFAEPAREMLHTGDWIIPRIAGVPLGDKPPLTQWSIAAAMAVLGTEAEWAVRLPSIVSGVAVAVLVCFAAARAHGPMVGLLAGLIQASCLYMIMQSRLAEADMPLCAAVVAAYVALACGVDDHLGSKSPRSCAARLAFFTAAGLAFLAKGPVGLVFVLGGSALFAALDRRSVVLRFLLDPFGWAILAVLVLSWPIAALLREPSLLGVWWSHNAGRFSGTLGGRQGPLFYLYTIPWLMLPWTPLVLLGLLEATRQRFLSRPFYRLLACWFVMGLLVLTLSAWKHKHYLIPILPPLSIVAAVGLARAATSTIQGSPGRPARLATAGATALVVGPALAGVWPVPAAILTSIGVALGALGWAEALRRRARPMASVTVLFAATALVAVAVRSWVLPAFDLYRPQAELAQRVDRLVPPGADLSVVGLVEPQPIYYIRTPVHRHDHWDSFVERLSRDSGPEPRYVVGPARLGDNLRRLGATQLIDRAQAVHPGRQEPDRLVAYRLNPEPARVRLAAQTESRPIAATNAATRR